MNRNEHLLTSAAEEAVEVAQRLTKALRFGLRETQEGQNLTNAARIREELADLRTLLAMIEEENGLDFYGHEDWFRQHQQRKREKVERYLDLAEREGTLQR
jgi:NTP pyrophosphatase (non-canonical NTP hydrolase)